MKRVIFDFPSEYLCNNFVGYMSDGGGEYMFMEAMDMDLDFDYSSVRADGIVRIEVIKEEQ